MAVELADSDPASKKPLTPAHKVYKDLGMSLKEFKARAAEVGITIKAAISKLSEDQISTICKHLGIPDPVAPSSVIAEAEAGEPARTGPSDEALEAARKLEEEETRKLEEEAARKLEEETARTQQLASVAGWLGVKPEQVDTVSQVLGISVPENESDIDDGLKARLTPLYAVIKIAEELDLSSREVFTTARSIGIEVGRKAFKGLTPNEEFMLRAMVKQKHKSREERQAEVTVDSGPEYKPAPPTGNKAVAEAPKREARRAKGGAAPAAGTTPQRAPGAARHGGTRRREHFKVSQMAYDGPRGGRRGGRRRGRHGAGQDEERQPVELPTGPVTIELPVNLRQLSEAMGTKAAEILVKMIGEGLPMVRITDSLSKDLIEQIGIIFDREITVEEPKGAEDLIAEQLEKFEDDAGEMKPRPPIVTVMGHVDHGKTSLLDAIADLDRVSGEAGGITQHIGAFHLDLVSENGAYRPLKIGETAPADAKRLHVTFIDTPGHEAFTAMRARGADVTDIAVIVVAADDGVMPQTEEAISHARSAEVEIVIAITKIDKAEANVAKVRQQLASHDLMSPDWGGNNEFVEVSSVTRQGIDELVQVLSDVAELLELRAIADKPALGSIIEAHLDTGRGIVATMLIKEGTLRRGDVIVAGHGYGRVRAMVESRGDGLYPIEEAGPGIPVEVAGLDELPEAGSPFHGMKNLKKAAEIAGMVRTQEREMELSEVFSLEDWSKARAGLSVKELVVVLKCDVQGTAETVRAELTKLVHEEVKVKVIHSGVGQVTTTDVHLAEAAHGLVVGFHVGIDPKARELADNHHVEIRCYDVIYKLIDEIRDALGGLLTPELIEFYEGTAEVRKVFRVSKVGMIAGCVVTKGVIKRTTRIRLQRDGANIFQGQVASLKRLKDDASEVREGFECGIQIQGYDDLKEGDVIEAFRIEEHARTLD